MLTKLDSIAAIFIVSLIGLFEDCLNVLDNIILKAKIYVSNFNVLNK